MATHGRYTVDGWRPSSVRCGRAEHSSQSTALEGLARYRQRSQSRARQCRTAARIQREHQRPIPHLRAKQQLSCCPLARGHGVAQRGEALLICNVHARGGARRLLALAAPAQQQCHGLGAAGGGGQRQRGAPPAVP